MNRRAMLTGTCIAVSSLASGCLLENPSSETGTDTAEPGADDDTRSAATTTETEVSSSDPGTETAPANVEDIMIVLDNIAPTEHRGALTLSADSETILEENFTVAADERQTVDTEITETGQYELRVATEAGTETSSPFRIDAYDLNQGSDIVVEITADDIMILLQE